MGTTEYEPIYFFDKHGRLRAIQHTTSFDKRIMNELSKLRKSEEKRMRAELTLRHILDHVDNMDNGYDCSPLMYNLLFSVLESIEMD